MIRGAIFDADGTLLDSMGMWATAEVRYLATMGIQARPGLSEVLFDMTLMEGAAFLQREYGLPLTPEEVAAGINRVIYTFYQREVRAKPGAAAFLEGLRQRGVRITLATNTDRAVITEGLRSTGLLPLIEQVFTCGELGTSKRASAKIFDTARDWMGTATEETWVFEDAVHAARTAGEAGYPVAGVADPYSDQRALKQVSRLYLNDLTDLAGFLRLAGKG